MDKSVGVDQICELLLLADRYSVDNLKDICENTLITSIDSESVIYLLGISDRFNAAILKARCLSYVSQHMELTKLEIFNELPGYLKVLLIVFALFKKTQTYTISARSRGIDQLAWSST